MNKNRRAAIEKISSQIADLKYELEILMEEEEEYRDNIPENLQGSERYELADSACYSLGEAIDSLDSAIDSIEEAVE